MRQSEMGARNDLQVPWVEFLSATAYPSVWKAASPLASSSRPPKSHSPDYLRTGLPMLRSLLLHCLIANIAGVTQRCIASGLAPCSSARACGSSCPRSTRSSRRLGHSREALVFSVKHRSARTAHNPRTRVTVEVPHESKQLQARLNGGKSMAKLAIVGVHEEVEDSVL
jgi:hypothetical protein